MKKNNRLYMRISDSDKALLEKLAKEHRMSLSEYICFSVKECESVKNQIYPTMILGEFIAGLYSNPDLSSKAKQIIGKEIQKYV